MDSNAGPVRFNPHDLLASALGISMVSFFDSGSKNGVERYFGNENRPRSPRILFVGEAVCLAHVGRPAMLARWAKEAGYDATFACGPNFANAARNEGIEPEPLETIGLDILYQRLDNSQFFYTADLLDAYVKAERALLRRIKPDLVVGDFRLTLNISARLEGVPMLNMINAHWSPGHPCKLGAPRAGLFKHIPVGFRNALFGAIRPMAFRIFAKPLDDLRARHGLPRLRDFRKLYTAGDACAYLDVPELIPLGQVPKNHFYLGPLAWQPRDAKPEPLSELSSSRPLAYVTMGSSGDEGLLPEILRALMKEDCNVVLSGIESKRVDRWRKEIPQLQNRLQAGQLFDPNEVLAKASLTICHGGSGTVYQSLSKGVPLLCLPHNPDQGLIAQAVTASGSGRMLYPERAKGRQLQDIISQLLTDSETKTATKNMAQVLQAWNTKARWQRWLNAFFTKDNTRQMKATNFKPEANEKIRVPVTTTN